MLYALFMAAAALIHPNEGACRARLFDAVVHAHAVAFDETEAPLFSGPAGRYQTALLLLSIAYRESRWDPKALNPQGDAGIMQTRALWWDGHTREEILADARLGYRVGLHALQHLRETCGGNALRWLGAFASGKCGGAQMAARARCGPVGLCEAN
jgi:soluble lytic murein transglycosylase-like protein